MKHTKGPWKVLTYENSLFKIIRENDNSELPSGKLGPNSRLIESAPEMLEILQSMIEESYDHGCDFEKYKSKIEKLLTKIGI